MAEPSHPNERAGWEHLFQNQAIPPRYDTLAAPNDSVVEWASSLLPGSFILDVGCGIGRHVVYLGGRGFKMAGVDLSPTGVKKTSDACAERQIDFEGRVSDMTALPWPDMTFDAALSTSTVCHHMYADIVKTMAEVSRVLKPGGLFLVDFLHKNTQSYQQVLEQTVAGRLAEVEPNTFIDQSPKPDTFDDAFLPHHYCNEEEVRDFLRSFEILKLETYFPDSPSDGGLSRRGYWVAWVRKPLLN
jgi:tellurite methyltransferase